MSPVSSSQKNMSPGGVVEASGVHFDELVVVVVIPGVFLRGPYETSLIPLYVNHASRHVWDGEVK